MANCFAADFSWEKSARTYLDWFEQLHRERRAASPRSRADGCVATQVRHLCRWRLPRKSGPRRMGRGYRGTCQRVSRVERRSLSRDHQQQDGNHRGDRRPARHVEPGVGGYRAQRQLIRREDDDARWKRKANEEFWRELDREVASRKVRFEWVRGHAGDKNNERADKLAASAARGIGWNSTSQRRSEVKATSKSWSRCWRRENRSDAARDAASRSSPIPSSALIALWFHVN